MKTDQGVLAVSQVLGVEICTLYQYSNRQNKHYSRTTIRKENGKERTLHVPCRTLKYIQRRILEKYLYKLSVSEFATAYISKKKLLDNAAPHRGKAKIHRTSDRPACAGRDRGDRQDGVSHAGWVYSCVAYGVFDAVDGTIGSSGVL